MARKPTHRREMKRLDSKKVRAAEKGALEGGHVKNVRTGGWAGKDDRQPPLPDIPSQGKKHAKKKEVKYCPARKHEGEKLRHYYVDREEVCFSFYSWWKEELTERRWVRKYRVCMYCKGKGHRRKDGWRAEYRAPIVPFGTYKDEWGWNDALAAKCEKQHWEEHRQRRLNQE